jgi:hypothetical protein
MRWKGHVTHLTEKRKTHRVLEGKPEGNRFLGKPGHTVEYNIKMNNMAWETYKWQAIVNMVVTLALH